LAYLGLVPSANLYGEVLRDIVPVDRLPPLPFDHGAIAAKAVRRLRDKSSYSSLPGFLLPEEFTLQELWTLYERITGEALDKANFRRQVVDAQRLVEPTGRRRTGEATGRRSCSGWRRRARCCCARAAARRVRLMTGSPPPWQFDSKQRDAASGPSRQGAGIGAIPAPYAEVIMDHSVPLTDDARYDAIRRRDPALDGTFVFAVRTTGVYCRPNCPARLARRENVEFHLTPAAAGAAGFRPCLRCQPDGEGLAARHAAAVQRACRLIEAAEEAPTLAAIAAAAGLSPHHLHRVFKAAAGVTPKAYAGAHLARRAADRLRSGGTVTEAIYDAGYSAPSRFYEQAAARLGMTPTAYRHGGAGAAIRFAVGQSSLGAVLVAATDKGVCAILLGDDPDVLVRDLQDRFPRAALDGGDRDFDGTIAQVIGLVEAPRLGLHLPLDIGGTLFQQRVWQALQAIPPGQTRSYAAVAAAIGSPAAVRAVAGACAANPLAVAVPCHRVVRRDGGLSGYRWGIERKRALLDREAA